MSNRKWNKGKPPHIGWWNASVARDSHIWRWWNGVYWSLLCHEDDCDSLVKINANCAYALQHLVKWTDFYPRNARVPRINPDKEK